MSLIEQKTVNVESRKYIYESLHEYEMHRQKMEKSGFHFVERFFLMDGFCVLYNKYTIVK